MCVRKWLTRCVFIVARSMRRGKTCGDVMRYSASSIPRPPPTSKRKYYPLRNVYYASQQAKAAIKAPQDVAGRARQNVAGEGKRGATYRRIRCRQTFSLLCACECAQSCAIFVRRDLGEDDHRWKSSVIPKDVNEENVSAWITLASYS